MIRVNSLVKIYPKAGHYPELSLRLRESALGNISVQGVFLGVVTLKDMEAAWLFPGYHSSYFSFEMIELIDFNSKMIDDNKISIEFESRWLSISLFDGRKFKGYWPGNKLPFIRCENSSWQKLEFARVGVNRFGKKVRISNSLSV